MSSLEINTMDQRIRVIHNNAMRVAFQLGMFLLVPVLLSPKKPADADIVYIASMLAIAAAIAAATWFTVRLINNTRRYAVPVEVIAPSEPGAGSLDGSSAVSIWFFVGLIAFGHDFDVTNPLLTNAWAFAHLGVYLGCGYIFDRYFMKNPAYIPLDASSNTERSRA